MSVSPIQADPNFFGKDSFVPFVGQVEDVVDPKKSGRIKVRCLGWHPVEKNGDNGLSTDDLPWTRTCMPVTLPHQMRSGAKHGLIPGSWVVGFFADGSDANDPYVFATFNFTAKASEENNRQQVDVSEGRIPDDIPGFTKIDPIEEPNAGLNTKDEMESGGDNEEDIAHDTTALDDSTDGDCPIPRSAFTDTKEEVKTASNPHSQNYSVEVADGLCGNVSNARGNISNYINQLLPSGVGRIVEGDDIFDINGNIINLNGIINKLGTTIANLLKDSIQTNKSFIQKTINKKLHSTGVYASATRSPITAQLMDQVMSVQFDLFNSLIDKFVGQIDTLVIQSLQNINNQQASTKGDNNLTGEYGTSRSSIILDLNPIEITDAIITDIDLAFQLEVDKSNKTSEEQTEPLKVEVDKFDESVKSMTQEDYENSDDMNDAIQSGFNVVSDAIQNSFNDDMSSMIGLGDVSQYLQVILQMDFTLNPAIFNKSGLAVLDFFIQDGCSPYDLYNTFNGYMGSISGILDKNTGGGSESGKSSKKDKDVYQEIGFGGRSGYSKPEDSTNRPLVGEPRIQKIGQSKRKTIQNKYPQFTPVDYYEEGRKYNLTGEVEFFGVKTKQSRVLVNNQTDPTENGIYVTGKSDWTRGEDADSSSEITTKKLVVVKSLPELDGLFYYSGKDNPKIGYDHIEFKNLHTSTDFTQEEKNAFDHNIEISPDGSNGSFITVSRPSSNRDAALSYIYGIPNTTVITHPGKNYFFKSKNPLRNYPSIVIEGYIGTPVPVVDPNSGELVSILINYNSFGKKSNPSTSIFEDDSSIGISTEDPNYDVVLSGFYIVRTGNGYDKKTTIKVIDKDRELETAIAKPKVKNGRITYIEVINNGTGFKRIPRIKIENTGGGKGCKLYPIMGLKPKESNPSVKKLEQNVALSISPSPTNAEVFSTINVNKL